MRKVSKKSSKGTKGEKKEVTKAFIPDPQLFGTSSYFGDPDDFIMDEKRFKRFIQSVERLVRKSLECKSFIKYLKDELKLDHCYFFENVKLSKTVTLELHHTPFTLYDIVKIVATKMIMRNEKPISSFMVAKKVTELHYRGIIGLVPLSKTIHQLVHVGKIVIPPHMIFGNIIKFIEEYKDFIEEDSIRKIYSLITLEDEQIREINSVVIPRQLKYSPDSVKQREELKQFFQDFNKNIIEAEANEVSITNTEEKETEEKSKN